MYRECTWGEASNLVKQVDQYDNVLKDRALEVLASRRIAGDLDARWHGDFWTHGTRTYGATMYPTASGLYKAIVVIPLQFE